MTIIKFKILYTISKILCNAHTVWWPIFLFFFNFIYCIGRQKGTFSKQSLRRCTSSSMQNVGHKLLILDQAVLVKPVEQAQYCVPHLKEWQIYQPTESARSRAISEFLSSFKACEYKTELSSKIFIEDSCFLQTAIFILNDLWIDNSFQTLTQILPHGPSNRIHNFSGISSNSISIQNDGICLSYVFKTEYQAFK